MHSQFLSTVLQIQSKLASQLGRRPSVVLVLRGNSQCCAGLSGITRASHSIRLTSGDGACRGSKLQIEFVKMEGGEGGGYSQYADGHFNQNGLYTGEQFAGEGGVVAEYQEGVSTIIKMARTQRAAILTGESTLRVERVRSSKLTTHSLPSTNVWTAEASAYQLWHLTLTRSCCGWATWEVMSPPIMGQACSSTPASRYGGNI